MRNYLKYHSPGVQFVVFMGLAAGMFLIFRFIAQVFFGDALQAVTGNEQAITPHVLNQFRWAQIISPLMTFVLPAYLYAYLSDEHPLAYLGVKKNNRLIILFSVFFLLIAAEPLAIYLGQLNQQIDFGPNQKVFEDLEKGYENTMNNFMKMSSPVDLFINLFIVAILPAICEELFFRASLQNILERWTRSPWVAIILSSLAFAVLHMTVFKLMVPLTLGIVLGILFYITRNILYNFLFHFLNNSIALLVTYYGPQNAMLKKLAGDDIKVNVLTAGMGLLLTILIFVFIRRKSPYEPLQPTSNPTHFDIE